MDKKTLLIGILVGTLAVPLLVGAVITTTQIADNAVTSRKIAPGAVRGSDVANGAVTKYKLAPEAVTQSRINDNTLNFLVNGWRNTGYTSVDLSIAAGQCVNSTITVLNADMGDRVVVTPFPTTDGVEDMMLFWDAWISADDTVTLRVCNPTSGNLDPAQQGWRAEVFWNEVFGGKGG